SCLFLPGQRLPVGGELSHSLEPVKIRVHLCLNPPIVGRYKYPRLLPSQSANGHHVARNRWVVSPSAHVVPPPPGSLRVPRSHPPGNLNPQPPALRRADRLKADLFGKTRTRLAFLCDGRPYPLLDTRRGAGNEPIHHSASVYAVVAHDSVDTLENLPRLLWRHRVAPGGVKRNPVSLLCRHLTPSHTQLYTHPACVSSAPAL